MLNSTVLSKLDLFMWPHLKCITLLGFPAIKEKDLHHMQQSNGKESVIPESVFACFIHLIWNEVGVFLPEMSGKTSVPSRLCNFQKNTQNTLKILTT